MRGLTPAVPSPHPLIDTLPGLFQDDPLAQAWAAAVDDLLAPVFCTLDGFAAYLDPALAPVDFLRWLAGWLGLTLDPRWPLPRQRAAVAGAVELYRWRGTAAGLAAAVHAATGLTPQVTDSGGTTYSTRPGEHPDPAQPSLTVRLAVPPGTDPPDLQTVRHAVELARPAHVPATVEVITEEPPP